MSSGREYATLGLFVVGIVLGVVGQALGATVTAPADPAYPSLPKTDEPAGAHEVAQMVANADARGLSQALDSDLLKALQEALTPIIDVRSVKFAGATEHDGRVIAAYVATGKTRQGEDVIVGFALRVRDNNVVGVN